MCDIKWLKRVNDDDLQGTLDMIKTVARAQRDLKYMGLEEEMHNSTVLGMIESVLPEHIMKEWIAIIVENSVTDRNKFELLMDLLSNFRYRIEHKIAKIRCSSRHKECNSPKLSTSRENTSMVDLLKGSSLNTSIVNVNETSRQVIPGRVNTVTRNDIVVDTSRNTLSPSHRPWCWMCSTNNHPVWKCQKLIALDTFKRTELVKENGACFKCLRVGHYARNCYRKFKCRVANCDRNHHDILHDSSMKRLI